MSHSVPNALHEVVIVGGGVIGCSVAYHLTKLGIKDVVLLERKTLTCGTTWHAAGLVGQLRATYNLTRLAQYTTNLYASLEQETGQATGFKQNGSISIALNDGRLEELIRGASMVITRPKSSGRCPAIVWATPNWPIKAISPGKPASKRPSRNCSRSTR